MPFCSTCKRPILWARSEHGRPIPIDPAPRPDGNIVLRPIAVGAELLAHVVTAGEETDEQRYASHFSTCPEAETHRRREKRAA